MDEDRRQLDKALREANEWIAASSIHDGLGENEGYDEEEDEDEVLMQLDSGEEEEEDEVERNLQNQIFNVGVAFPAAIRRSADDDIGADTKSLTEHTVEMADDDRKHPPNPQRIPVTPESIANLKGAISQARKIISGLRNQVNEIDTQMDYNSEKLKIAENLKNYAYNLRKGCTVAKRANNKRFYTFATVVYKLPFFKDKNGSEPKPHPNVTLKEQMLEGSLSQQITTSRLETFTDDEKRRLENAVRIAKKREWIKEQVKNTRKTLETTSGDHRRKLVVASVKLIHRLTCKCPSGDNDRSGEKEQELQQRQQHSQEMLLPELPLDFNWDALAHEFFKHHLGGPPKHSGDYLRMQWEMMKMATPRQQQQKQQQQQQMGAPAIMASSSFASSSSSSMPPPLPPPPPPLFLLCHHRKSGIRRTIYIF